MSDRETATGTTTAPAGTVEGSLVVKDQVLLTLARQASTEVEGVLDAKATDATRTGRRAWLDVEVEAGWPCDVAALGGRVRRQVLARAQELTPAPVERVDVTVRLRPGAAPRRVR